MLGASYPVSGYNTDVQLSYTAILGDSRPIRESASRTALSLRFADEASLRRLKPSILLVLGLNRWDFWFNPRVQYRVSDRTTLTVGVDWLGGPRSTLLGQFRDTTRFQVQVTRSLF
jgi:hypothetical protein